MAYTESQSGGKTKRVTAVVYSINQLKADLVLEAWYDADQRLPSKRSIIGSNEQNMAYSEDADEVAQSFHTHPYVHRSNHTTIAATIGVSGI